MSSNSKQNKLTEIIYYGNKNYFVPCSKCFNNENCKIHKEQSNIKGCLFYSWGNGWSNKPMNGGDEK